MRKSSAAIASGRTALFLLCLAGALFACLPDPNPYWGNEGGPCFGEFPYCNGSLICNGYTCRKPHSQLEGYPCQDDENCIVGLLCNSDAVPPYSCVGSLACEKPHVQPEGGCCTEDLNCLGNLVCNWNGCELPHAQGGGDQCRSDENCAANTVCEGNMCIVPSSSLDGGASDDGGGADAGDATVDGGVDAASD